MLIMLRTIDSVCCFFITFVEYPQMAMVFCGAHLMTINPQRHLAHDWHMIKGSFIEQGVVCGPRYHILFGGYIYPILSTYVYKYIINIYVCICVYIYKLNIHIYLQIHILASTINFRVSKSFMFIQLWDDLDTHFQRNVLGLGSITNL